MVGMSALPLQFLKFDVPLLAIFKIFIFIIYFYLPIIAACHVFLDLY